MSDDESTQEIDIQALRASLAAARAAPLSNVPPPPPAAAAPAPLEPEEIRVAESIPIIVEGDEPSEEGIVDADIEEIFEQTAESAVGTMPREDVAEALRAMMAEPADGDTYRAGSAALEPRRLTDLAAETTEVGAPRESRAATRRNPNVGSRLESSRHEGSRLDSTAATPVFGPNDLLRDLEDTASVAELPELPEVSAASFPDPEELPDATGASPPEPPLPRFKLASVTDFSEVTPAPPVTVSPDTEAQPSLRDTSEFDVDPRLTHPDSVEEVTIGETRDTIPPETNAEADEEIVELDADEIVEELPAATNPAPERTLDAVDDEERALLEARRFGPLIALYKQRIDETKRPRQKVPWLVKTAAAYETGLGDSNEAFETLVAAFELVPDHPDVIEALDRVAKTDGRVGELAERVKKKLLPGAPDDKRLLYLGHLVYWYERVLGRGSEVGPFLSDIERQNKGHPAILRRSAQLAATNGDTRTEREHLRRALERTVRREERIALLLALAGAHAGTPEMANYYQSTLAIDPTSIVAIQGLKRIGIEKENYGQVIWALERQAEVAPTEAERVDALLELATIQETRFLKREEAAALYERVLVIEPSQPGALKALERCYHALRDWKNLARIVSMRADHTYDPDAKVEVLELAAEVYESKLGDLASAASAYRKLLILEPKHRRALTDLGRLYEKLGDWTNLVVYKGRLADLAPTKRATSQEYLKLGDFLNAPERDPVAAKGQYERAAAIDPSNAAAWEALQRLAAEAGDTARVIECLEQRKNHTEIPRQRAAVLVELARTQRAAGLEPAARASFEAAIRTDASNEAAAAQVLEAYTAAGRWAEAAPLCELLVNAAIRDRDGEALFVRLRLGTRIAAALGDADRALTSAISALSARPKDPGAQSDLLEIAHQCRELPDALARVREPLALLSVDASDLSVEQLFRLGQLLRDAGDVASATATFEEIRRVAPDNAEAIQPLTDLYLLQGEFARTCKLKIDVARRSASGDVRFTLFCEAGEIWARRAGELEKAASVFEEARAIKPLDPWLLQSMAWLYGELGEWGLLVGILEDMAESAPTPEEKVQSLVVMSQVVRDRLGDRNRSVDILDRILDADRKRLDVFEELVRAFTETKDWERLERAYRKMIARVKDDGESQLHVLLFHQLGLIYRDRLGDTARAFEALDAASRLSPDNTELRKTVVELLVVTDRLDNAVARLRNEIDRDPHRPDLYGELYELFLRQHAFDKAWCAVNVLTRLREPTPDQRRFHNDYAPMPLDRVPGQLVDSAWRSHVFHEELDDAISGILRLIVPVVTRMRLDTMRTAGRSPKPFTPANSRLYDLVRTTIGNASEILSVPLPDLVVNDLPTAPAFMPSLASPETLSVCAATVETQSGSLIYLAGKALADLRPELAPRALFPSVVELSSLLASAVRVSRNEVARDPAGAALDQSFASALQPREAAGLRSLVLQVTAEKPALDVQRWARAADLSSFRAGLLLAGDVEPARLAIIAEAGSAADPGGKLRIGELYKFATSDLYSDLRGAIGVAVQT